MSRLHLFKFKRRPPMTDRPRHVHATVGRAPLTLLAILAACAPALADTTIDTISQWNGSQAINSFGETYTATYGQTFTVTGTDTVLEDFTFLLKPNSGPDANEFRGYVMAWGGDRATGPVLFESDVVSTAGSPANAFTPYTIDTGGLELISGQTYVAFFNASKEFDGLEGSSAMAVTGDVYSGGSFYFQNGGSDFNQVTSAGWVTWPFVPDAAFTMHFTGPNAVSSVPEPGACASAFAMFGTTALGLVKARAARRRRTAASLGIA